MVAEGGRENRARTFARMVIDALAYAVVVAGVTFVLALATGIATGGGVVRAKILLFLAGWLFVGIATVRLWPKSPRKVALEGDGGDVRRASTPGDTRIESVADALPPLRWMGQPPRRISPAVKLFVGGLLVLLCSFLLEVVFTVE